MKTGTEDLLPRWDLFEAVEYLTGGAYVPHFKSASWNYANDWLRRRKYTGMEYCFYAVYYSVCSDAKQAVLHRKGFMCSQDTLDSFEEWKRKRPVVVRDLVTSQRLEAKSHINSGYPLRRVLMEDFVSLAPVVRLELALGVRDDLDELSLCIDVMEKFAAYAYELVLGSPEYIWFCPRVKADLAQGENSEFKRSAKNGVGPTAPA